MRHPNHLFPALVLASAAVILADRATAQLAESSPFAPPDSAGNGALSGGPTGPIELRGVMATSQGVAYCIYDTAKKTSQWVGLNESGNAFMVRSADPSGESITVDYQGRNLRLVLRTAKIASLGSAAAAPSGNPALTSAVVVNPSPADEQKRLDAVAAEVRRRRMEREKAFQATTGGGAPQGPAPNR